MTIPAPGDDVCNVPPPLVEEPPQDRYCDIVMTGGVASGVVYPWAALEIARAFRLRNIGGTSVGAMAAALTAAAEYGRRNGEPSAYEALRRTPGALGEVLSDGRTRMLSLFQTNASGRRLIELWGRLGNGNGKKERYRVPRETMRVYPLPFLCGFLAAVSLVVLFFWLSPAIGMRVLLLVLVFPLTWAVFTLVCLVWTLWGDFRDGVIANGLGLCKGGTTEEPVGDDRRPGISEWLHDGIQRGAGFKRADRPLTFRDLWCAPLRPGGPGQSCEESDPPESRSINLQMLTTNVTHTRPYRLPLGDQTSRLFYKRDELKGYFPTVVLDALEKASRPYVPCDAEDPPCSTDTKEFLELPGADMPIVVASRLSLSYPLLFSAVPLWAIDYDRYLGQRVLRRCLFTDGGLCSNFPIHLFDAAVPRWPTFGLWLDRRDPKGPWACGTGADEDVELPKSINEGLADSWDRFDPLAQDPKLAAAWPPKSFGQNIAFASGFVSALLSSAKDWRDLTTFRLPHVRNRVARLQLLDNEGGLNIGMPRKQILTMAECYGTAAGKLFVERFSDDFQPAARAWQEQRWVRAVLLIQSVRERLGNLRASLDWQAHTVPLREAIEQALKRPPVRDRSQSSRLDASQAKAMLGLLDELETLQRLLNASQPENYTPLPTPELRLRAPL